MRIDTCLKPALEAYIEERAVLFVNAVSSIAGETVRVVLRVADMRGVLRPTEHLLTVAAGELVLFGNLPECYLVTASLSAGSATTRGQTFASLRLRTTDGRPLRTILAGYVTTTQALTYPPISIESSISGLGNLRLVYGTIVAAQYLVHWTVPSDRVWRFHALAVAVWTKALVADRQLWINISDGALTSKITYPAIKTIPADKVWRFIFADKIPSFDASAFPVPMVVSPFVAPLIGPSGKVEIAIFNAQTADQFLLDTEVMALVEEYLIL